jgi:AcrR family transcriptional regulator
VTPVPADPPREPRRASEIADATLALLVERGYDDLTIEGVADRAGVNKTTIYRWWPSKAELVGAAVQRSRLLEFTPPDTGSLRGDLRAWASHVAGLLTNSPTAEIAQALLCGVRGRELAGPVAPYFAQRHADAGTVLSRAVARGELPAGRIDPVALLDWLNGALWMRGVIRGAPIGADFLDATVDTLLAGLLPRATSNPRTRKGTR